MGRTYRTCEWFGFQHAAIAPDVITFAKALGNGLPIGVCLAGVGLLIPSNLAAIPLHSVATPWRAEVAVLCST